ncbi:MAG TPA: hypothetical protein PLQ56_17205 [Aggregatilineales bacterium]|nr:hypothetical protein [Aggregatilineales bacterium]
MAANARPAASQRPSLAGGGIRLASRRQRRHLVTAPRFPAVKVGTHVAVWRRAPVLPLNPSATV